jgi:hypothetical protein
MKKNIKTFSIMAIFQAMGVVSMTSSTICSMEELYSPLRPVDNIKGLFDSPDLSCFSPLAPHVHFEPSPFVDSRIDSTDGSIEGAPVFEEKQGVRKKAKVSVRKKLDLSEPVVKRASIRLKDKENKKLNAAKAAEILAVTHEEPAVEPQIVQSPPVEKPTSFSLPTPYIYQTDPEKFGFISHWSELVEAAKAEATPLVHAIKTQSLPTSPMALLSPEEQIQLAAELFPNFAHVPSLIYRPSAFKYEAFPDDAYPELGGSPTATHSDEVVNIDYGHSK